MVTLAFGPSSPTTSPAMPADKPKARFPPPIMRMLKEPVLMKPKAANIAMTNPATVMNRPFVIDSNTGDSNTFWGSKTIRRTTTAEYVQAIVEPIS